jgi:hypothetical protein
MDVRAAELTAETTSATVGKLPVLFGAGGGRWAPPSALVHRSRRSQRRCRDREGARSAHALGTA